MVGGHATSKCQIVTSNPVINPRADGNIWFGSRPCRSLDDAKLTRSTISSCAAVEEPPATTQDDERKSD